MTLSSISLSQRLHAATRLPGDVKIQQHKSGCDKICSHFSAHTQALAPEQQRLMSQQVVFTCPVNISHCKCTLYLQFAT